VKDESKGKIVERMIEKKFFDMCRECENHCRVMVNESPSAGFVSIYCSFPSNSVFKCPAGLFDGPLAVKVRSRKASDDIMSADDMLGFVKKG
jgi:hypothetical protein